VKPKQIQSILIHEILSELWAHDTNYNDTFPDLFNLSLLNWRSLISYNNKFVLPMRRHRKVMCPQQPSSKLLYVIKKAITSVNDISSEITEKGEVKHHLVLIITELAESYSWMVQAENVAVPVLDLIGQFSTKVESTLLMYSCHKIDFSLAETERQMYDESYLE